MPDDTPTARRTVPQTDDGPIGHPSSDYHSYGDDRLRQCFTGATVAFSASTGRTGGRYTRCVVEERLRVRGIDPLDVVAELNDD
ncbi:hypothetical protein [Halococcus thailandensis]|uniref:Uncharacterized protein n=1 Tax=Halococcus thailandensis JCM 13552 TaxID=1227457 RepID=M0MXB9_9EURY|nr:hypothetical protein [Halococcus thailandensis]EMA50246.1 hypothetical protein C451_17145 [Halococcus thailandensis JCM 13552]